MLSLERRYYTTDIPYWKSKKKNLVGNFYETQVARDINIKGICGESGISLAGI